ncbi:ABC transporter ATP-binding protein [Mesorhizobium sp.]|uniref:ABC transporter ATP-binding protein n=1 Tax=Mesorhizobium sp. TaxID=1871066 RepID=UPI000FE82D4E|nr:ABC transporter ATP-binding protein [Mesorhizobium sp.]RWC50482.1 MAG: ABC transporter ATP-binding protein [Mesorhizobium sp.]RWC62381.1 MAG: ABC transporter ATP-binding protein [Mesorhizobium sp.]RWC65687.1 MAG: ABC transporter ATP-binding protein [Mesorhizobium sp.]
MISNRAASHNRQNGELLLDIRNLTIEAEGSDGWQPIVKDISLHLRRGEVLGIIGESGAGKSTLGLAALGFTRPGCHFSGGSVTFDGRDLLKESEERRRQLRGTRIAYVAQSAAASFNPAHRLIEQTIECVMMRGLASRGAAVQSATDLFAQMQLPDPETIGDRFPHQVSGGQLQRAMTAMAMTCKPDLIVFDEPTTALDVTTQVEVLASIRKIVEEHHTAALYITHDLAVVAQMAHRIMVLRHGELVEHASTQQMLSEPEQTYTRSLWAVRTLEKPEEPPAETILSVSNVDAHYGDFKALDDISIEVPRGRTVAVVGESGSGKSTLARVISGLLPSAAGAVSLNGVRLAPSLKQRSRDQLRRIQMIYQSADTALNPRQTVMDLVGRPLSFHFGLKGRMQERRVAELLDMVELSDRHIVSFPSELSGGQKQRVAIARAIAADPDVFICDEITSALDQLVQEQILKLLLNLQKEMNKTYLFITHDIATVNAIADQVVVMCRGGIVQQGAKRAVMSSPDHPYTKLLLSAVPQMDPGWLDTAIQNGRLAKQNIE